MRNTKKLLKTAFGKKKEGYAYIQGLLNPNARLPTLFIYSPNGGEVATDFARWLYEVAGSGAWVSEDQFYAGRGYTDTDHNIFIADVSEITDPFLMKVLKTRNSKNRLMISCQSYPNALRYVKDPSFTLIEVPYFDIEELRAEMEKVVRKLG